MDPSSPPGEPGFPPLKRGPSTDAAVPSSDQSFTAPTTNTEAGATATNQPESFDAFTNRFILKYAAEAYRRGHFNEDQVRRLELLDGQVAAMIALVSRHFACHFSVKNSRRDRKRAQCHFHFPPSLRCNSRQPRQPSYNTDMSLLHFRATTWNACNMCPNT